MEPFTAGTLVAAISALVFTAGILVSAGATAELVFISADAGPFVSLSLLVVLFPHPARSKGNAKSGISFFISLLRFQGDVVHDLFHALNTFGKVSGP